MVWIPLPVDAEGRAGRLPVRAVGPAGTINEEKEAGGRDMVLVAHAFARGHHRPRINTQITKERNGLHRRTTAWQCPRMTRIEQKANGRSVHGTDSASRRGWPPLREGCWAGDRRQTPPSHNPVRPPFAQFVESVDICSLLSVESSVSV